MWIRASGEVREDVYLLTTPASSHILFDGDMPVLCDTGIAAQSKRLLEEVVQYSAYGNPLKFVFLTNARFDTIGAIPALRAHFKDLKLVASRPAAEILEDKAKLSQMLEKNKQCAEAMNISLDISDSDWNAAMKVDSVINGGDSIELGDGREAKTIQCSGFGDDGMAYYVAPDSVLFAGEAVGAYGGRGKIAPTFTNSYSAYLQSLDKFSGLDIRVLGLAHSGVITGNLALQYIADLREACKALNDSVKERIVSGELVDEIAADLYPEWTSNGMFPGGPFVDVVKENINRMVNVIAANE